MYMSIQESETKKERETRERPDRDRERGGGGRGGRERETWCPPTQRNDSANLYLYWKGLRIGCDGEA